MLWLHHGADGDGPPEADRSQRRQDTSDAAAEAAARALVANAIGAALGATAKTTPAATVPPTPPRTPPPAPLVIQPMVPTADDVPDAAALRRRKSTGESSVHVNLSRPGAGESGGGGGGGNCSAPATSPCPRYTGGAHSAAPVMPTRRAPGEAGGGHPLSPTLRRFRRKASFVRLQSRVLQYEMQNRRASQLSAGAASRAVQGPDEQSEASSSTPSSPSAAESRSQSPLSPQSADAAKAGARPEPPLRHPAADGGADAGTASRPASIASTLNQPTPALDALASAAGPVRMDPFGLAFDQPVRGAPRRASRAVRTL